MKLHFILGRAGSGKTHTCIEQIVHQLKTDPLGPPVILLVPEQATFQMEQALVKEVHAVARARVLSFRRLANLILLDTGGNLRPFISEIGKKMLVRSLVNKHQDSLNLLGVGRIHAGLVKKLLASIKEFRIHRYSPQDIKKMAKECTSPVLKKKLMDLALIYSVYDEQLQKLYSDSDLLLDRATEKISDFSMLKEATVWMDGFSSFTPQEYAMIQGMLPVVKELKVALCIDTPKTNSLKTESVLTNLFKHTAQTYQRLKEIARDLSFDTTEEILSEGKRFVKAPVLAHIEKSWDNNEAVCYSQHQNNLQLHQMPDRIKEVEGVAQEILRLCRDHGYRFRDISVITRNISPYSHIIPKVFRTKGIPFFMDQIRSVHHHPLVSLILSSLEMIITNWNTEAVVLYLKTDFTPVTRPEADLLEKYVLEHGITGSIWKNDKPWEFRRELLKDENDFDEEENTSVDIDSIRLRAIKPVLNLEKALTGDCALTPGQAAQSFAAFFEELKVRETLHHWIQREQVNGDIEAASIHMQVWDKVVEVLEQLGNYFSGYEISLEEFYQMMVEATDGLSVGVIPPKLDQVLVGVIDRSRQPNVKATFIIGVIDGEFPAINREETIITRGERDSLMELGYVLGEATEDLLHKEQFLVYIALTRASEYLWISYPMSDDDGKALNVSMVFRRIKKLIPNIEVSKYKDGDILTVDSLATIREIPAVAASMLQRNPKDPYWLYVKEWLVKEKSTADWGKYVFSSLEYSNHLEPLPYSVMQPLYGLPMQTSVSRLETFAQCPFKHFATYGLSLKERETFKLDPSKLGMLSHAVLKDFVDCIMEQNLDIDQLDPAELIDRALEKIAQKMVGEIIISSSRQKHLVEAMGRSLKISAKLILEHLQKGSFRPIGTEVRFNGAKEELSSIKIQLKNGSTLNLVGVIDRIDQATIEGEKYIRIVDYKSSMQRLELSEVYYGVSLQLLLYLAVASEKTGSKPAGALYAPVFYPIILDKKNLSPQDIWVEQKKVLKNRGLLLKDLQVIQHMHKDIEGASDLIPVRINKDQSFAAYSQVIPEDALYDLLLLVRERVNEIANRIISGEHQINPIRKANNTRACEYCPYHCLCCFDVLIEGNEYRYLHKLTQAEILKIAKELSAQHYEGMAQNLTQDEHTQFQSSKDVVG